MRGAPAIWNSAQDYATALTTYPHEAAISLFGDVNYSLRGISSDVRDSIISSCMSALVESDRVALVNLVCEGDSLTAGGADGANGAVISWPTIIRSVVTWEKSSIVSNAAVGGQRLDPTMLSDGPQIDALYSSAYLHNIVTLLATNDLADNDPDALWTDIQTWCAARKLAGFKIILLTYPNRVGSENTTWNANRKTMNTYIRENYLTVADEIADIALDDRLGADDAPKDTAYWCADTVHPDTAGEAIMADVVLDSIYRIIV